MDAARRLDRNRLRDDPALAPFLVRPGTTLAVRSAPTGLTALDALLGGGFPRGRISEVVGPRTSGRTRLLLGALAAATARGALAALVDVTDGLDPASAQALGVDLGRLLWVRCGGRLLTAWQAVDVIVRGRGFDVVAVDLGDRPPWTLGRVSPAVIVRLQRAIEATPAALLLVGSRTVAGSLAAVAVALRRRAVRWERGGPGLLAGLDAEARLVRSRTHAPGDWVRLAWSTALPRRPRQEGRHG